jgi:hypothetical protein
MTIHIGSHDQISQSLQQQAWLAAFRSQMTDAVAQVQSFARRRARLVEQAGALAEADDLVAAALVDTLAGVVHWEPSSKSLALHLQDVIRYRSRHAYVHANLAARHMMTVSHALYDSPLDGALQGAASLDNGTEEATQVLVALRELADGDDEVMRLLTAYGNGQCAKPAVKQAAGLDEQSYRRALRRLRRKTQQLSQSWRSAAD